MFKTASVFQELFDIRLGKNNYIQCLSNDYFPSSLGHIYFEANLIPNSKNRWITSTSKGLNILQNNLESKYSGTP